LTLKPYFTDGNFLLLLLVVEAIGGGMLSLGGIVDVSKIIAATMPTCAAR
jgi:hypothetical protein